MATFKFCQCCNTKHGSKKRVCRQCKVPAIWREPTNEEITEHETTIEKLNNLIDDLLNNKGD